MSNKNIINRSIKLYFEGKDWINYLKEEVRKSKGFENTIKNIIKGREDQNEK